jgi:hypothetical protein
MTTDHSVVWVRTVERWDWCQVAIGVCSRCVGLGELGVEFFVSVTDLGGRKDEGRHAIFKIAARGATVGDGAEGIGFLGGIAYGAEEGVVGGD